MEKIILCAMFPEAHLGSYQTFMIEFLRKIFLAFRKI